MSSGGTFVDKIDPFAKRTSLKKKQKKSQGSSRYRTGGDVELTALPLLKGNSSHCTDPYKMTQFALPLLTQTGSVVTMIREQHVQFFSDPMAYQYLCHYYREFGASRVETLHTASFL